MAEMKKSKEELILKLEEEFHHYDEVFQNGCNDPLYSDGVNLNLIRNHIIYTKRKIEESFTVEEYPDIYYRRTPKEVPYHYMTRPDEIRKKANEILEMFMNYAHLDEFKNACYYLDENQLFDTGIRGALCTIHNLDEAIRKDNLVEMRRLSANPEEKIKDFEKAFENLNEINMEEERQISLFEMMM